MELSLTERIDKLINPYTGVKRGLIEVHIPGKGGRDHDDKLINIRVGELREIYNVLVLLKQERTHGVF